MNITLNKSNTSYNAQMIANALKGLHHINYWCLTPTFEVISTTSENPKLYELLLTSSNPEEILAHCEHNKNPLFLNAGFGLMWGACSEWGSSGALKKIHIIGPVLDHHLNEKLMNGGVSEKILDILKPLPVVSVKQMLNMISTLDFGISGRMLEEEDIHFLSAHIIEHFSSKSGPTPEESSAFHRLYTLENALINMMISGKFEKRHAMDCILEILSLPSDSTFESARENAQIITTVAIRAGIKACLTPEHSYTIGRAYRNQIRQSTQISELSRLLFNMISDFSKEISRMKDGPKLSRPIQTCCDFISSHIEDNLTLAQLAENVGYAEYYLSQKFKKETGNTINNYLKEQRISYSKDLLAHTDLPIEDIAKRLHFCTRSYYSSEFHKLTGYSPAEYRREHKI